MAQRNDINVIVISAIVLLSCWSSVFTSSINTNSDSSVHHRRRHSHSHRSHHQQQDLRSLEENQTVLARQEDQNELQQLQQKSADQTITTLLATTTQVGSVLVNVDDDTFKEDNLQAVDGEPKIVTADIKNKDDQSSMTSNNNNNNNESDHKLKDTNVNKLRNLDSDLDQSQNHIVKENSDAILANVRPGCRSCMLNKQIESTLPKDTVRNMRLELIKEQILKKLGVSEPPTFLVKDPLPEPIARNILSKRRHTHVRHRDVEDFYGKTEQVIVFPEDVLPRCATHLTSPSACFTFNFPQENHVDEISSAELWVYKVSDERDGRNQSLWVYEVSQTDINHSAVKAKFIDAQHDVSIREGWLKLNLTTVMPKWLKAGNLQHTLQIGCKTCLMSPSESPVVTSGDQRPFIVINYRSVTQKKRSRRNINCSSSVKDECCRESFIVSFAEIGWDNWIIAPAQYNAYFCKGSCVNINGLAHSSTRHTTVMQKYINMFGINNRTMDIVPCCTAAKMSAISLVYRDPNYFNTTVKYELLPNMVVDSCTCL